MLLPQLLFLNRFRKQASRPGTRRFRRPAPGSRPARDRRWWRRQVAHTVLLIIGIFSAALGLKGFLLPSGFLDGGVTGVSLLLTRVFGLPLPALIVVLNAPFVLMAWFQLDRRLAVRTLLGILGLALVLSVV